MERAYNDGQLAIIDDVAARLAPDDPEAARVPALGVFAVVVGTIQISRALSDTKFADEVLEQGVQNALTLLRTPGADEHVRGDQSRSS